MRKSLAQYFAAQAIKRGAISNNDTERANLEYCPRADQFEIAFRIERSSAILEIECIGLYR